MPFLSAREIGVAIISGLVIGATSLAIGEGLVRFIKPNPKIQIVREDRLLKMQCLDDTVVWEELGNRQNLDCVNAHPDARRIVVIGSSILYGSSLSWPNVFSQVMQERLNAIEPVPGFCVINLAQPAFGFDQKAAIAREYVNVLRPHLVIWEVWQNDLAEYVIVGESAYDFHELVVDESGLPNAFGVSPALNEWLFVHFRLYEYAMLVLAKGVFPERSAWMNFVREKLSPAVTEFRAVGADVLLVTCPWLDRPFAQTADDPPDHYGPILDYAQSSKVRTVRLEQLLDGEDVRDVRLDSCCHYNEKGHSLLGERLAKSVFDMIDFGERRPCP